MSLFACLFTGSVNAGPITHTDESLFQSAAGLVNIENFEGYDLLDPVSTLSSLGGSFGSFSNGSLPAGYDQSSGGYAHSGNKTLINNDKNTLPGLGDIIFNADLNTEFFSIGLWNTGGDDVVRLSVFDINDVLLESIVSEFGETFIGITGLSGGVKAVISAEEGNGWFSIDDLQTSTARTVPVPEPVSLALLSLGLAGITFSKKRKQPKA